MNQLISTFLQQKNLSKNSQLAYQYDLQQFWEVCEGQFSAGKLEIYLASLQQLKATAQQRKLSAVNQFLYFLYEEGQLDRFVKLKIKQATMKQTNQALKVEDLSDLWLESDLKEGQLIALLIAVVGLTPAEIAGIRSEDLVLDFSVLTVERDQVRRVVSLTKEIIPYLEHQTGALFLFDKKGHTYSRQWFFNRLSQYVASLGQPTWTAQKLREQYILHALEQGKSLEELVKELGLKSMTSLEKFRKNGY
ncbi:site-specific tyrosine recombinase XerD [Streptococcus gallolyticus]|uniref:site-specific tyrosine recombinase XerD n=1 Tax=Streptococcus hepaticus TaxID=3349163 RepID=UPI001C96CA68|nr:site-specific tyrosine recombinase XerD [Streptococcus gallolyticus]MBY5040167.1 site-specific tyrosine recombinase XerD [Streptococcus gallolyticus]